VTDAPNLNRLAESALDALVQASCLLRIERTLQVNNAFSLLQVPSSAAVLEPLFAKAVCLEECILEHVNKNVLFVLVWFPGKYSAEKNIQWIGESQRKDLILSLQAREKRYYSLRPVIVRSASG
jgi:hypothetical protein